MQVYWRALSTHPLVIDDDVLYAADEWYSLGALLQVGKPEQPGYGTPEVRRGEAGV